MSFAIQLCLFLHLPPKRHGTIQLGPNCPLKVTQSSFFFFLFVKNMTKSTQSTLKNGIQHQCHFSRVRNVEIKEQLMVDLI